MIRALFKKQLAQVFSFVYMDTRRGKRRHGGALLRMLLLYGFLFLYLGVAMFMMAKQLCEALVPMGLTWFFFALLGLLSLVIGVIGSIFSSHSSLYGAKDNNLLLSLPIPVHYVLLSRLLGVWATGFFYQSIVFYPALLAWFIYGEVTPLGALLALLIPVVLSFLVLSLSCLLGFLVSLISAHTRHKSLVITLLSLVFIALYFWGYSKLITKLTELLAMLDVIAERAKGILFPLYHMGLAAEGNALSMLIFTGIVLALFGIVYAVLSYTFLRLATANLGTAKRAYRAREVRAGNTAAGLLRKELRRLFGCPIYLLNCGLSAVMLPAAAIALFVMRNKLLTVLPMLAQLADVADLLPLILTAMLCMLLGLLDITAPSISLEGRQLWILQSLPVSAWEVLRAKLTVPFLLGIPALILALPFALAALSVSGVFLVLIPLVCVAFLATVSLLGLVMNLLFPNFKWTTETLPVKQSVSVTVTLFGSWVLVVALGGLYYLLREQVAATAFLGITLALLCAANAGMLVWLKRCGTKRFTQL